MLGDLPYLDFLDTFYPRDEILKASKSKSLTPYGLFYVYTVQQLKPFFQHFGRSYEIAYYEKIANDVRKNIISKCYDSSKGLFADNPEKKFFSQPAHVMEMLTSCVPPTQQKVVMQKVLGDTALIPVSLYFKFYQFEALKQAGMGEDILNELGDWKAMLNSGMNTFSEWLKDPRSECYSWSAYPAYYFLNTVAGIEPAKPGFTSIKIQPRLGSLKMLTAQVPHPDGIIKTMYKKINDNTWNIQTELPPAIKGVFIWKEKIYPLNGTNKVYKFLLR